MNAEDFSFHNCPNSKIVKDFSAVFPRVCISIFSDSFIIESINCSNLPGLMVPSEECNVSWVLQFETKQELEGLHRVVASINKVSHKNVSGVWYFPSFVEKFEEIMELAMDITANSDRCFNRLHIALLN